MKPANVEQIENETPFVLDLTIENVLEGSTLSDVDRDYFIRFAERWVRWQYANNPPFKNKMMKGDRQYVEDFIAHWRDAFNVNPERFKDLHPVNMLV
jgi:hypothetical protein